MSVFLGLALLSGVLWLAGMLLGPARPSRSERDGWLLAAGLVVGAVFVTLRLGIYIGDPTG